MIDGVLDGARPPVILAPTEPLPVRHPGKATMFGIPDHATRVSVHHSFGLHVGEHVANLRRDPVPVNFPMRTEMPEEAPFLLMR